MNTRAVFMVNIHRADKCKDASPWLACRWPLVVRPRLCTIHDVNVSEGVFIAHDRMGVLGAGFDGMPGSGLAGKGV